MYALDNLDEDSSVTKFIPSQISASGFGSKAAGVGIPRNTLAEGRVEAVTPLWPYAKLYKQATIHGCF